jgi:hypothetical protein
MRVAVAVAQSGPDADAGVHTGYQLPTDADTASSAHPDTYGRADRSADADTVRDGGTFDTSIDGDTVAYGDAAGDADTDAVARTGIAEPRPRGARHVRFRGHDRVVGLDLAPLPELVVRSDAAQVTRGTPLDKCQLIITIT